MNRIFFWNWHLGADKTIARFDSGQMSSKEKFRLFLVISVLISLLYGSGFYADSDDYLSTSGLYLLVDLVSVILGLLYLYWKHTESTSFIEKFFVVVMATIPAILICILLPLYLVSGGVYHFLFGVEAEANIWYELGTYAILNVAIYLKQGTYFK